MATRSSKAMRVVIFAITMLLFLFACSQPPVGDEDDLFECDFSKDGKFLVCHDRKRTETAGK